jgi:hypothetical protein
MLCRQKVGGRWAGRHTFANSRPFSSQRSRNLGGRAKRGLFVDAAGPRSGDAGSHGCGRTGAAHWHWLRSVGEVAGVFGARPRRRARVGQHVHRRQLDRDRHRPLASIRPQSAVLHVGPGRATAARGAGMPARVPKYAARGGGCFDTVRPRSRNIPRPLWVALSLSASPASAGLLLTHRPHDRDASPPAGSSSTTRRSQPTRSCAVSTGSSWRSAASFRARSTCATSTGATASSSAAYATTAFTCSLAPASMPCARARGCTRSTAGIVRHAHA